MIPVLDATASGSAITHDVSNNFNGILLLGAKNNSILDNTVRRNLSCGIRLEKADGNTVRNNSLDENLLGVFDDGLNYFLSGYNNFFS